MGASCTIHRIAMRAVLLFSSLLALGLCLHDSVIENVSDFNDFQVFRAEPKNREEADFLHSLRMTATHYDFWTEVRVGGAVDIMVPQEKREELLTELEDRDIKHSLHIQNVQELIEKEKIPAAPERWQMTRMAPRHAMTRTEYHSLEDMYTYLDYIEAEFDFVTTPTGSSFPLPTLMATTGPGTTTGCGGRRDLITEAFSIARASMQTATGVSTGTRAAPPMTSALTRIMDQKPSPRLKMSTLGTTSLQGRTSLSSTTRSTATAN